MAYWICRWAMHCARCIVFDVTVQSPEYRCNHGDCGCCYGCWCRTGTRGSNFTSVRCTYRFFRYGTNWKEKNSRNRFHLLFSINMLIERYIPSTNRSFRKEMCNCFEAVFSLIHFTPECFPGLFRNLICHQYCLVRFDLGK